MKKFMFSLERVLRYKRTLYETERNTLASLRTKRRRLEEKRDSCENQLLILDKEFRLKAANEGVGINDINQLNYQKNNGDKLIEQLDEEMATLDIEIEKQLEIVMQLDKDVKGLEKLREKQFEEYTAEAMKEEQERVSELVSSKYIESRYEAQAEEAKMKQDKGA